MLRLSELQSDDIKLDKVLYEACANDRARLCVDVPQMYKCLMDHTSDKLMSDKVNELINIHCKLGVIQEIYYNISCKFWSECH